LPRLLTEPPPPHLSSSRCTQEPRNHFPWPTKLPRNKGALPSSSIKYRGSDMFAIILNEIYRQFLNAALPGMASQGARQ
jgi:hypothetical protein